MPLAGVLALVDAVAAVALLLSVPRQRQNRLGVLSVAVVLIGIAGWLAVLAIDSGPRQPDPPAPSGRVA